MAIVEINAPFYNPRSKKCRNCGFYRWRSEDDWSSGHCTEKDIHRFHNDRACVRFRLAKRKTE